MDAFDRSGLSAMAFARSHGVCYQAFIAWQRKSRDQSVVPATRSCPAFAVKECLVHPLPEAFRVLWCDIVKLGSSAARRRLEVIIQVRGGRITAVEGARRLGISRKSYYQWEARAMRGLVEAVTDRRTGRPPVARPDPETGRLRKRAAELEKEQQQQASALGSGLGDDAAGPGQQRQANLRVTESQILEFLEKFERLRMQSRRHSALSLCRSIGLSYSTLRRWRSRWRANLPVKRRPGPPGRRAGTADQGG